MILDRLNAFMFAHPIVSHAVGLAQFVPLQISKIEPICVAAWAARTIIPGLSRKQIRQCRW